MKEWTAKTWHELSWTALVFMSVIICGLLINECESNAHTVEVEGAKAQIITAEAHLKHGFVTAEAGAIVVKQED